MKLRPLINRAPGAADGAFETPADQYYCICPKGEYPHAEAGVIQVIDDIAVRSMASAFTPGEELLCDFEHDSHNADKPTKAAGWIQNLVAKADGLWALIKWSVEGAEAVKGGMYRYISPVWLAKDCESLGNNQVRPLRLYDAGLTNRPNLVGIPALSNRKTESPRVEEAGTTHPVAELPADLNKKFDQLVRNRKAARNITFERSWGECTDLYHDIYLALIHNMARASDPSLAWLNRLRQAPPHINDVMAGTMINQNPQEFLHRVDGYQSEEGLSFERAWDKAQRNYPSEWNQYYRTAELIEKQR